MTDDEKGMKTMNKNNFLLFSYVLYFLFSFSHFS